MNQLVDLRRVGGALAGVVAGTGFGVALGSAFGGGVVILVGVALAVGAVFLVAWNPLVGVAMVPAAVGLGNDPLPGAPMELQAVHVVLGLTLAGTLLHVVLFDGQRLRRPGPVATRSFLAVAAFVVASVVSGLLGRTPLISLSLNVTLIGVALLCVVTALAVADVAQLRLCLRLLVVGSVAATSPVLGQVGDVAAQRGGTVVDNRPSGSFVDPNELGAYTVVVLVLALVVWASGTWIDSVIGAIGTGFAVLALVMSFSRGSWVAAVCVVGVLVVVSPARGRLVRLIAGGVAVTVALVATSVVSLPLDVVSERAETLVSGTENPYDVRPFIWQASSAVFLEDPVLGAGPGSFPRMASEAPGLLWAYPIVHAHNGALTVAAENGALGLLAAAGVIVAVGTGLSTSWRRARARGDTLSAELTCGLLVALVGAGGTLVVDYTLRNPLVLMNLWFVVGLAIAAADLGASPPREPATRRPAEAPRPVALVGVST